MRATVPRGQRSEAASALFSWLDIYSPRQPLVGGGESSVAINTCRF